MNGVKVQSLDTILALRAALWKFLETASSVLSDAEAELQRTLNWLETEADSRWRAEIRHRQEEVAKAKAALRAKKMFKSDLSQRSVVDEEKALRLAQARLEEAERTLEAVHRWRIVLQKEVDQYKGQVQRFAGSVAIDIPMAVNKLDALLQHLRDYLAIRTGELPAGADEPVSTASIEEAVGSMARAEPGVGEGESRGEGETQRAAGFSPRGDCASVNAAGRGEKETGGQQGGGIERPGETGTVPHSSDPGSRIHNPESQESAHGPL